MKKVIKAHRGMAHVPKPSGQQAPTKGEGSPLRGRRRIGLPQRFRGRSPLTNQIKAMGTGSTGLKDLTPEQQRAVGNIRKRFGGRGRNQRNDIGTQPIQGIRPPRQPRPVRPPRPMAEPPRQTAPVMQPRPPRPSDAGMGGRPTRIQGIQPPRPSDAGMGGRPRRMVTPRRQMPPKRQPRPQFTPPPPPQAIPRIMNQGGYVSRAKYGIVDNLKGK